MHQELAAQDVQADVCVVGGGPAGLTLAAALDDAGLRVLLVEAGAVAPPPGGEDITSTASVGLPYPIRKSRARGLGGSSLRWDIATPCGAPFVRLRELDDLDFDVRPGISMSGWPFGKDHLRPWYRRAWSTFGLSAPAAGSSPDSPVDGVLVRRPFAFGPADVFTRRLPEVLLASRRTTVLTGAVVTDIRTDDAVNRVSGLVVRDVASGRTSTVRAPVYVLAAGGLENARLLMASRSAWQEGVANTSGLLGRCFMEHPHYASGLVLPARGGFAATPAVWDIVADEGTARQAKYGLDQDLLRAEGLLNAAAFMGPRPPYRPAVIRGGRLDVAATASVLAVRQSVVSRHLTTAVARHALRAAAATPAVGSYVVRQSVASALRRAGVVVGREIFTLAVMAEQEPLRASQLRLAGGHDEHGVPKAVLDWRIGPLDGRSMQRTHELLAPGLGRLLGGRVESLVDATEMTHLGSGYHHMGTTRMSSSAHDGVVDPDCRAHGLMNLYVAGSSVFPTGGCANPTLTIVALAIRLADHLQRHLQGPVGRRTIGDHRSPG